MSGILRHDDTSISNDQEQVDQPEKKTNISRISHNVDGEHRDERKTIRISEIFENFENDINKSHFRQHSEFENNEERNRSSSRVSEVITVKDVDHGMRSSIQSQTANIIPKGKDGTDTESNSQIFVNAIGVNQKDENEHTRSTFKLKREQSVEHETKHSGETEKLFKDSDLGGDPRDYQNEEKVKHMKYTDGKQEDTVDVCYMRHTLPPVSHHDWREYAQENDLDKQRNDDSDLSVKNTAEKYVKEGVEGSQGSMKEAGTVSQRKNKDCNRSEGDIAINLLTGDKVGLKPDTPTGDSNQQGKREIHSGCEKGIICTISRDNANYSGANITEPSIKRRISDEVNEGVNEAECETTFGIVEEERREESRIRDDIDLNTGGDCSRLLENQSINTFVSNTNENVQNDENDESLSRTHDCKNNGSNIKSSLADKELIHGSKISLTKNPIRSDNPKENNCLENDECEASSSVDASGYSWGKKDYRRDATNHISDSEDTKLEQNYQENAKNVDSGEYSVTYQRLNEAVKEKDGEDNLFLPEVESDDSNEEDQSKTGYKEEVKGRDENGNLSKGTLTTILVSREEEERKRQGKGYSRDKKHIKRGDTRAKYRIGGGEKKRDGSERKSFNYEEVGRIGGAAIAQFTKQYKHKKHIEHVLEEDTYRSDREAKYKANYFRKPDESVLFHPNTGNVRSRIQRDHIFRVPRLKRNKQGRPIGGYCNDLFGPTEQEEVEAELETLDISIDYNNISGKRTSSSRQYLRIRSARDLKKEDAMTAKTVVFDVPDEGEAMSLDGSELSELRKRGRRDITSAMRRKLRNRLFTRIKERGKAAPSNSPLGCTMKHGWVQTDSNTMETDERCIVGGGGRFLLNPLVRVCGQQSPTWSPGSSISSPGKHSAGPYRRSIGELSFDMEQERVFEQGLENGRKVLHIEDEQKMSKNEHNMRAGRHTYYGSHDHAVDEMDDFDEVPTEFYDRSSTFLSDDGRLIVREKGCPDLKPSTASTWGYQTGGYRASLSHPSYASVRLHNNHHSHIMESDNRLLQKRGETYKHNMTVRSTYLNSTRLSANYRLRRLLEELFSDKNYLDHLIETTEPKSDTLMITRGIAEHGRDFLIERADYWEETGPLPPRPALIQYGFRKSRAHKSYREDTISISPIASDIR
ncbi:hypothetical protein CHS0354_025208 [Potamilus streckersoni]|uniref:Uncharacterized protein n=1 Tax=Potamilus streckersoni TaxID=2493646 RepID=A0AAE0RMU9_9BIVA|nr:hypothetical protein CHS0354_025208 [Potamilus streckersoni]